jgi:hypothetical protein
VLSGELCSVLVYDVVPEPRDDADAVTVTVASEQGWSLVGVLAAEGLSADAVVSVITTRGLDAATNPVAQSGHGATRLAWLGPAAPGRTRRGAR